MQDSRGAPSYGRATLLSLLALALPAYAAEREHTGPHEIVIYMPARDYSETQPNVRTISGPFETYEQCVEIIKRVRLKVQNARVQCDPILPWRVN